MAKESRPLTLGQALEILEMQTLKGETQKSLRKKWRLLAQQRHPDNESSETALYTFDETKKAYDYLLEQLEKGNLEVYTGVPLRPAKVFTLLNYCKFYEENSKIMGELLRQFDLYDISVDMFFKVEVEREIDGVKKLVIDQVKRCRVTANMSNKYSVTICAPLQTKDKLSLHILDLCKIESTVPGAIYGLSAEKRISTYSKMLFSIMVRKEPGELVISAQ